MSSVTLTLGDAPVPLVHTTFRMIRDCNEEFAALFGYRRADLVDTSFSRLYPALADFVRTGEMWRQHLSGGAIYYDERVMSRSDGSRFWCRVRGRARDGTDAFASALYCFEPIDRPIHSPAMRLTARQRQVLTLVAQGKTSAAIAAETGLSRRTVEAYRLRLARSLGVANTAELVAWFLRQPAEPAT